MIGFISKRYKWIKAITNIRALYYDFDTHLCTYITLGAIDDIVITNKRVQSNTQRTGNDYAFRAGNGNYSFGNSKGSSETTRVTIEDVLIMYTGAPIIRLYSVEDPEGVASLIRAAAKGSKEALRAPSPLASDAVSRKSEGGPCHACGLHNPASTTLLQPVWLENLTIFLSPI